MSRGNCSISLIALLGISACEREPHGAVSIYYRGCAAVDESGMVFGEFYYANDTANAITSVALAKQEIGYVCLYPQFEYLEDDAWHKIEVFYAGAPDPVVIQPYQQLFFEVPMETLYSAGQKQAYRILVDEARSVPFSFELAKNPPQPKK